MPRPARLSASRATAHARRVRRLRGRALVADLEIRPLTPERFADLAGLFEEGGDPRWCWCMYFRKRGLSWSNSTPDENRSGLHELAGQSPAPGLVGYRAGRAVGWVSVGPREDYGRLEASKVLARVDETPVWSIVCFVVSRKARGQGVAAALLDAAIAYARAHGAQVLEAYPVADERGRVPAASAYRGPQSMFAKAGFELVAVRRQNSASPPRPIMRLALARRAASG